MKQRGLGVLGILIGIAVAAATVTALVYSVTSYVNGVGEREYQRGKKEVEGRVATRDAEALRDANTKIAELTKTIAEQQAAHAERLSQIDAAKTKEINDVKDKAARDVRAIRAGALKLRDPGRSGGSPCPDSGGSPSGTAIAAPGVGDGKAGTELSREASEFLSGLASEADTVIVQLQAAQAIIVEDRRLCNAGPAR